MFQPTRQTNEWPESIIHKLKEHKHLSVEDEIRDFSSKYSQPVYRMCISVIMYLIDHGMDELPQYEHIMRDLRTLEHSLSTRSTRNDEEQQSLKLAKLTLKPLKKGVSWFPFMDSLLFDDEISLRDATSLMSEKIGLSSDSLLCQYKQYIVSVLAHPIRPFAYWDKLHEKKSQILAIQCEKRENKIGPTPTKRQYRRRGKLIDVDSVAVITSEPQKRTRKPKTTQPDQSKKEQPQVKEIVNVSSQMVAMLEDITKNVENLYATLSVCRDDFNVIKSSIQAKVYTLENVMNILESGSEQYGETV